jgi:hypothetical protein
MTSPHPPRPRGQVNRPDGFPFPSVSRLTLASVLTKGEARGLEAALGLLADVLAQLLRQRTDRPSQGILLNPLWA